MTVNLVWITPDAEKLLVHMARVSNPASQAEGSNPERLIRYLIRHKHWSPFEMVSACFEIETTRDIGRQILRHRSLSFQEFSQRYAETDALPQAEPREARLQDITNRQHSLPNSNTELQGWWLNAQVSHQNSSRELYELALAKGIAKEVARSVLPEGLTMSRMYASGSLRSWIHYTESDEATQAEHREVADGIRAILAEHMPATFSAAKSLSHEKACIMTVTPMCCAPCVECGGTLPATETSGPRRPGAISRSTARPAAARRCSACSSW